MAYKHILIAVDLSPQSQILVEKAVSLARPYNSKISFIHANINFNTFYSGLLEQNSGYTPEEASQQDLRALKAFSDMADYPVTELLSGRGELAQVLSDTVVKYDIDLVVCGHHQDFWGKLMSSARQLVNALHVDMLIVPIYDEDNDEDD